MFVQFQTLLISNHFHCVFKCTANEIFRVHFSTWLTCFTTVCHFIFQISNSTSRYFSDLRKKNIIQFYHLRSSYSCEYIARKGSKHNYLIWMDPSTVYRRAWLIMITDKMWILNTNAPSKKYAYRRKNCNSNAIFIRLWLEFCLNIHQSHWLKLEITSILSR